MERQAVTNMACRCSSVLALGVGWKRFWTLKRNEIKSDLIFFFLLLLFYSPDFKPPVLLILFHSRLQTLIYLALALPSSHSSQGSPYLTSRPLTSPPVCSPPDMRAASRPPSHLCSPLSELPVVTRTPAGGADSGAPRHFEK